MLYLALKHVHVTCVVLSGLGFLLRGVWMLRASPQLQQRWVRVLPHVIDTTLLASALGMAFLSAQYPFALGWLTAKITALLVYIVCGAVALRRGRTRRIRLCFFLLALMAFGYIVMVALTRNPAWLGDLAGLKRA